jgi:hypothetical protein
VNGFWLAVVLAQTLLLLVLAVIVLGQLRRMGVVLEAAEGVLRAGAATLPAPGLPPGATVPAFRAGAAVGSRPPPAGAAVYLFVSADCDPCAPLLEELAGVPDPLGGVRLVVVADGDLAAHPAAARIDGVVSQDGAVREAFGAVASPSAFAVAGGTVVDARIVNTLTHLRDLAGRLGP